MDGHSPGHAALRRGRISEAGRIYLVTTATRERRGEFAALDAARQVVNTMRGHDLRGDTRTLCFVVMPDHLHWLFQLVGSRSLSRIVGAFKGLSARRLGRPVWQTGFHDHAVRHDEDLRGMARYIVGNPLRARLVERIGDYPHWDAAWL